MRKNLLVALIATLALAAVAASSALAGVPTNTQSGSKAYVTTTPCDPLETNQISQYSELYLVSNQPVTLDWYIYSQGTSTKNSALWDSGTVYDYQWISCGSGNLWYADTGTYAWESLGTYTLNTVYDSTGKNFSSDSFKIVAATG